MFDGKIWAGKVSGFSQEWENEHGVKCLVSVGMHSRDQRQGVSCIMSDASAYDATIAVDVEGDDLLGLCDLHQSRERSLAEWMRVFVAMVDILNQVKDSSKEEKSRAMVKMAAAEIVRYEFAEVLREVARESVYGEEEE